jgi:hypothetical protein
MRRVCPNCGSTSVITFDADEDYCTGCKARLPGLATGECLSYADLRSQLAASQRAEAEAIKSLIVHREEIERLKVANNSTEINQFVEALQSAKEGTLIRDTIGPVHVISDELYKGYVEEIARLRDHVAQAHRAEADRSGEREVSEWRTHNKWDDLRVTECGYVVHISVDAAVCKHCSKPIKLVE